MKENTNQNAILKGNETYTKYGTGYIDINTTATERDVIHSKLCKILDICQRLNFQIPSTLQELYENDFDIVNLMDYYDKPKSEYNKLLDTITDLKSEINEFELIDTLFYHYIINNENPVKITIKEGNHEHNTESS